MDGSEEYHWARREVRSTVEKLSSRQSKRRRRAFRHNRWDDLLQVTPQVRAIIDKLNSTLMNISKANSIESLIQQIGLKSAAAGGIYTWLDSQCDRVFDMDQSIVRVRLDTLKFHVVYLEVKPKQMALDAANDELSRAQQAFSKILARVQVLEDCLTEENLKMQHALAEKDDAVRTKERLARQIDLAERLVDGLASSRIIWTKRVETLNNDLGTLAGDVLLVATFISYAGYFTRMYRENLINKWRSTIVSTKVLTKEFPIRLDSLSSRAPYRCARIFNPYPS
jgi:hypothetical protein